MRWIYPLIIGSLTGFFAFIINLSVENIAGFKFHTTNQLSESSTFVAFCFYMFCDVFLTMIATFLTTFVSPAAAGSGIPDVKVHPPSAPSLCALSNLSKLCAGLLERNQFAWRSAGLNSVH